ncbi:hypothetical protein HJC23_009657 [Cyclotella cryptica]|uniref:Uncharacterized protein n=1 Tax=Cyclotella cryptica TaxID=29204 RepID=A0ABD3PW56_9STRA
MMLSSAHGEQRRSKRVSNAETLPFVPSVAYHNADKQFLSLRGHHALLCSLDGRVVEIDAP